MAYYVKKNGVLTPLNGRSAQDYLDAKGRFIVDTTGLAVDTVVRVKSMTDNTKVWNQTVATVGTPLIFDVPCKDYYKICLVEDVSDVPTETVAIYKTVDYGQTQWIDMYELYPVIFENGGFIEGASEADIRYDAECATVSPQHYMVDGYRTFYGQSARTSDAHYLSFDLSKYVGKTLYFTHRYASGNWLTKGFNITNTAKKIVYGTGTPYGSSSWDARSAFGISYSVLPTDVVTPSDSNCYVQRYGESASNPILQIKKIWIAD